MECCRFAAPAPARVARASVRQRSCYSGERTNTAGQGRAQPNRTERRGERASLLETAAKPRSSSTSAARSIRWTGFLSLFLSLFLFLSSVAHPLDSRYPRDSCSTGTDDPRDDPWDPEQKRTAMVHSKLIRATLLFFIRIRWIWSCLRFVALFRSTTILGFPII